MNPYISPKIHPKQTKRGWGVFVKPSASIACGEIVEASPFSGCYGKKWSDVEEDLRKIVFSYPQNADYYVIGLGYVSLYNHCDKNNAIWRTENGLIIIEATAEIPENIEVFIHYGDAYWSGGWQKY